MRPFVLATLPACTSIAAFLGGELGSGRMGEDHEVVFVVAEDMARPAGRPRPSGAATAGAHVDALTRLDMIDGYAVGLERRPARATPTETEGYNA